jgi:nucleotide-binding universal stress UspA family protein
MSISEKSTPQVAAGVERIVVATDGGRGSRAALRWLADHLGTHVAQIDVVTVRDEAHPENAGALDAAGTVLRTLVPDCPLETRLLTGDPAEAILGATAGASLVVVGAETGGGLLTSPKVPAKVATDAACAVVVVPHDWTPSAAAVVAASAVDSASDAAVEAAAHFAERQGRELVLCHVWELPVVGAIPPTAGGSESIPERQRAALEQVAAGVRIAHPGLTVSTDLREASAAEGLSAAARGAALLVVGRRRHSAVARVLLGSVSHRLVATPPCPVMVVPAPVPGLKVAPDFPGETL